MGNGPLGWDFCPLTTLCSQSPPTPPTKLEESLTQLGSSPSLILRQRKAACQDSGSYTSSSLNIPLHPGVRVKCGVFSQALGNSYSYCPWLEGQLPRKAGCGGAVSWLWKQGCRGKGPREEGLKQINFGPRKEK